MGIPQIGSRLVDAVTGPAISGHHNERNCAELDIVHTRHLAHGVMGADVGSFAAQLA